MAGFLFIRGSQYIVSKSEGWMMWLEVELATLVIAAALLLGIYQPNEGIHTSPGATVSLLKTI